MKKLITLLERLWSRRLGLQRSEVRVTLGRASDEHPMSTRWASDGGRWKSVGKKDENMAGKAGGNMIAQAWSMQREQAGRSVWKYAAMLVMLFTLGLGQMWGQGTEGFEGFASSSTSYSSRSWTGNNGVSSWAATNARNDYAITGTYALTFNKTTACTITMKLTTAQKNAGIGTLSFKYKYPVNVSDGGNTISVTLNGNTHSTTLSNPGNTSTVNNGSITINESLSSTSVTINIGSGGRVCIDDLSWTANAGSSCSNSPTVGTVSANGPFTWNTSFPLSVSSIGAGGGCAISEYGFVWKSGGAEPTISDNKTKIGESSSATSFSGNITGSFATGTTYKVKAYVTNDGGNTTLSSAYTLVARTVTFNMNGHGDAPATQYVADGEKATQPADPSASGWVFGGWYKEAGCSNVWNFGTETVSGGNKIIYAKWTALPAYTVSFSTGTGNPTQANITEASAGAGITLPAGPTPTCSSDGWSFAGWKETSAVTSETTTAPTLLSAGSTFHPSGNVTLYAVYQKGDVSNNYELINDASEFVSGANYVIAAYSTNDYAIKAETYQNYYITATQVTTTDNIVSSPNAQLIWQITRGGDGKVTLYNANTNKYLGIIYDGSRYYNLKIVDDASKFTMTEEDQGEYVSTFKFESVTNSGKYIIYNSTYTEFTQGNSSNENIYLYKQASSTTYYSNPSCCTPPGTALSITGSSSVNMGSTLTLGTSGGNGGTVTWSVVAGTGAATINSSGVLTPSSAGTVTVKAHQDLNGSVCAQDVEQVVTISLVTPTATFSNGTYTIGGANLDLSTLFSSNSSGSVTYTITSAGGTGASIAGTSFTATTAGSCTVQAVQAASGIYASCTKTATITVQNVVISLTIKCPDGHGSYVDEVINNKSDAFASGVFSSLVASHKGCYGSNEFNEAWDNAYVDWEIPEASKVTPKPTNSGSHHIYRSQDGASPLPNTGTLYPLFVYGGYYYTEPTCPTLHVYYYGNGSDGGTVPTNNNDYDGGESVTVAGAGTMTRTNYNFLGWSTDSEATSPDGDYDPGDSFTITDDVYLYAVWCRDLSTLSSSDISIGGTKNTTSATITWSAPGATKCQIAIADNATWASATYQYQADNVTSSSITRTDLTPGTTYYVQIRVKNDCGATYKDKSFTFTTKNVYTITYNKNDGSGTSETENKTEGVNYTVSSDKFSRSGYTLTKWNTQADGNGTDYAKGVTYSTDAALTLYAVWSAQSYTVTLDRQSGTGGDGSVSATFGAAMPSATMPTRDGYNFQGYYGSTGGSGTKYYNSNGTSAHAWDVASNTTIYAHWTAKTYTNYRTTCSTPKTLDYITFTDPTKLNYLVGETVNTAGAVVTAHYTDGTTGTVTASTTWTAPSGALSAGLDQNLTASYTEGGVTKTATHAVIDVYAVTLLKKDETGTAISGLLSDAPAVSLSSINHLTAAETGARYTFKEWQVTNGSLSSTSSLTPTIDAVTGAITVTAVYYKPITVTWHAGGNVFSGPSEYSRGWTVLLPDPAPDPDDYGCTGKVFYGWSRTSDYDDDDDAPTDLVQSGDILNDATNHFYAVFAVKESNGSAPQWTKTALNNVTAGTYLICTPGGYAFAGSLSGGDGNKTTAEFTSANWALSVFNEDAPVGAQEVTIAVKSSGFSMYVAGEGHGYITAKKAARGGLQYEATAGDNYWAKQTVSSTDYWRFSKDFGSGTYAFFQANGNTDFRNYNTNATGNPIILLKKTAEGVPATYSDYATSCTCEAFSFHTGTGTDEAVKATIHEYCFEQVDASTTWKIDNYVIPSATKFFVGWQDEFKTSGLGTSSRSAVKQFDADEALYFEYTKAYGDGYRPSVGNATGAVGTLRIWSDNNWDNCHVGFDPNGYIVKLGSNYHAMHNSSTLDGARYKETDIVTLTSTDINGQYQVNIAAVAPNASTGVASRYTSSTNMTTMGVKSGAGDNWRGTNINSAADANTKGFFRIDVGDGGHMNWNAHWVPIWELTFDLKGGTGSIATTPAYVSVEAVSKVVTIPNVAPTKSGYRFLGWSNTDGGGVNYAAGSTHNVTLSGNKTVYAVWAQEFTVSYAGNGGTTSCSDANTYIQGETVTVCASTPTKDCSTFTGWLGDNGVGTKASSATFSMPAANVTLTAQWNTTTYALTYKDQGDVAYSGSNSASLPAVHTCGVATVLVNGERAGYRFDGWFTNSACTGAPITSIAGNGIDAPTTLYAKWTASHTFTFKDYENTTIHTIGQVEGGNVVMPSATPDCGLWTTFVGWVESAVAETTTEPSVIYREGDIFVAGNSDKEFKALYSKHEGDATVSYVKETSGPRSGTYVIAGDNSHMYIFAGFNAENSTTTYGKYATDHTFSGSDANVITNKGGGVEVSIIKSTNGKFAIKSGSYCAKPSSADLNTKETDPAAALVWQMSESRIQEVDATTFYLEINNSNHQFKCYAGTQTKAYLYRKKVAGTTYYATNPASCIVPTQVVVSYNDNKSHAGDQTISGMPSGTTLTFDPYPNFASYTVGSAPTDPTGYHFAGWNTSADGSGSDYAAGASVTTFGYVENITLYAKWERVYTVRLFDNGVERTPLVQESAGATVTLPTGNNCTPGSAFAFEGWTESAIELNADPVRPAAATLHAAGTYTPTSDITLYSVYSSSVAGCDDFAEGVSGAYKLYNKATNDYAIVTANANRYDKASSGTAEVFYIAYSTAKSAYTIRTSLGYLGWSGASGSETLSKDNATPYYWDIKEGTSGNAGYWNFQPIGASTKQFSGNGTYFNLHSNSTKYYIRLEKSAMTYYYNTALCGGAQITFHDGGGEISGTPTTPSGASWNSSTHVLSGLDACDKITTFPTASYDGWTFVGWSTEDYTNCGKHTAGTSQYSDENASTDEPDASIIYKTDGNPYVVRGGSIDLYPVFTRFPDNEPFDLENGGTFYMYYLDPSSDDGYGAPQRRYAGAWDGTKRYTATANCANATEFEFTKSGDVWHIQNTANSKWIGGKNSDDWLIENNSLGTLTDWTITIRSGNQFNATCQSGRQISVYENFFMDYASVNLSNNPDYHCVYLGSCEERIFSSEPHAVPTIDLTGEPYVTSSNGETVRATATMTLSASHLGTVPANKVIVSGGTGLKFATTANANPSNTVSLNLTDGKLAATTIYVYYTPTATEDGLENIIVTAKAYNGSSPKDLQTTGTVHCRHIPADFVIAAKWEGKWYALPNTCTFDGSSTAGVLITVDNDNDPTSATYAPSTTKWGLRKTKAGSRTDGSYNDRLVFTERATATANSQQALYNYNSAEVYTNATYTNYNNKNPERYEWIPVTSDFKDYTLTNSSENKPLILRNDCEFKAQTTNQAYDGKVRLLPATFFDDNVQIVEWKTNSVVIMYTGTETTAKAKAGSNSETGAQTLSSQKLTHGIYEVTTGTALTSHTGENLILTFGSTAAGKKIFEIPWIINGSSSATTGHDKHDVVILKNGKLSAVDTKYSFRNVYVYGGGKLKIASGKSIGVNNIILRAGGISTNGSGGSATYEYVYPQVELKGTLTSTKTNIQYEYITDYDHWYHLCLPFNGTLNTIHYPTEYYGDNVTANNTGSWIIKRYDGATRATGNYNAWVDIESESATQVTAGHGYIFWGAPKKVSVGGAAKERQQWGIQRITMPITAAAAITAENGSKTVNGLGSYSGVGGNSGKDNDQGWNLIGNPYMANLSDMSTTSLHACKLEKEIVNGQWTGRWAWNEDESIRYITIPDNHFNSYEAKTVSAAQPLVAGRTFFVQIAGAATSVSFDHANRIALMPAWQRSEEAEKVIDIETGIVLSDETMKDEVDFWIKNGKTEAYEHNADYPKTMNQTNFNIYGVHSHGELSWVAISPEIAEGSMAIGYQVPAAGEYTLRLSETYVSEDIEAVFVTDHEMNPEVTTNLVEEAYTFHVNQAETNNERFTASIKLKEESQTPTGLEPSDVSDQQSGVLKFLYNDKMYILRNGVLYDATGKRVK